MSPDRHVLVRGCAPTATPYCFSSLITMLCVRPAGSPFHHPVRSRLLEKVTGLAGLMVRS